MNRKVDNTANILKVIASIIVIISHIPKLPVFYADIIQKYPLVVNLCCAFSLNVFFIVTGFFMYNKNDILKSWLHVIKNFVLHIFIPFLIISFLAMIFQHSILEKMSIAENFKQINFKEIIKTYYQSFKQMSNIPFGFIGGHLWFVYSYFFIILCYPITWLLVKKLDWRIRIIITMMLVAMVIVADVKLFDNVNVDFTHHFRILPVVCSFIGYNIYHIIINKFNKFNLIKSILYLILFIWSFLLQTRVATNYYMTSSQPLFYYDAWYSGLSLLTGILFVLFIYSLQIKLNDVVAKIINFIAKNNVYIYLLHPYIIVIYFNFFPVG